MCYHPHMQLHTPADITGDGSAHTLASIPGLNVTAARWWQFKTISIASTAARIGDSGVSATQGVPVGIGEAQFSPPISQPFDPYDLNQIYYLLQSGDTASFSCSV